MTEPNTPPWQPSHGQPNSPRAELTYGLRPPPTVSEQVARELHANGVHTKCPADCLSRWDGAGQDVIPGYGAVPASAPSPTTSARKPLLIAVAVLVAVVGLTLGGVAIFGGFGNSNQAMTIKFSLFDAEGDGGSCSTGGSGGYSDIGPGTPVTVKDEAGKILASTTLPDHGEDAGSGMGCTWTMHVAVPDDAAQYSVEVGRRGAVTYSRSEMVSKHWTTETGIS